MTVKEIERRMTAAGSHWWDKETMELFGTTVETDCFTGEDGCEYFITCEDNYNRTKRCYNVRQYNPATNDIRTIGGFCETTDFSRAREMLNDCLTEE